MQLCDNATLSFQELLLRTVVCKWPRAMMVWEMLREAPLPASRNGKETAVVRGDELGGGGGGGGLPTRLLAGPTTSMLGATRHRLSDAPLTGDCIPPPHPHPNRLAPHKFFISGAVAVERRTQCGLCVTCV